MSQAHINMELLKNKIVEGIKQIQLGKTQE